MERYLWALLSRESAEADRNSSLLVYSTNKAILADGVGRRLENLFWRIWINPTIRDRITGNQVAALFSKISEGGSLRTTPTPSPRISRGTGSNPAHHDPRSSSPTAQATSPFHTRPSGEPTQSTEVREKLSPVVPQTGSLQRPTKESNLPPSILKKSRADSSSQLAKSSRILSPTFEMLRQSTSYDRKEAVVDFRSGFSGAVVTTRDDNTSRPGQEPFLARVDRKSRIGESKLRSSPSEASPRTQGDESQPSREKAAIHAKTGRSRRKPALPRRKSSQLSTSNPSNIASPLSSGKNVLPGEPTSLSLRDEAPSRSQKQPVRRSSPHPLKNRVLVSQSETSSSDDGNTSLDDEKGGVKDNLVEPNFRSKFASRIRPEPRPAGPPLSEGLSAQGGQASPFSQPTGQTRLEPLNQQSAKGKRVAGYTDEIIPLKPPGASGPDKMEEEVPSFLPRTKSQLTLLLEKDRQSSKDDNTSDEEDEEDEK